MVRSMSSRSAQGCSCLVLSSLAAVPGLLGHPVGARKGELFLHHPLGCLEMWKEEIFHGNKRYFPEGWYLGAEACFKDVLFGTWLGFSLCS